MMRSVGNPPPPLSDALVGLESVGMVGPLPLPALPLSPLELLSEWLELFPPFEPPPLPLGVVVAVPGGVVGATVPEGVVVTEPVPELEGVPLPSEPLRPPGTLSWYSSRAGGPRI